MIGLLFAACLPTETFYSVEVTATVTADADAPVYGEVLLADTGDGALAVPMLWVADFSLPSPGTLSLTVLVPDVGEGLAVYAWQDLDGDGLLCAPDGDTEPTGASFSDDFPGTAATLDVALSAPCLGPERYAE